MVFLMTELVNLTNKTIRLKPIVGLYYFRLKDVPPKSKVCLVNSSIYDSQYRILMDGEFTGKKLYKYYMLACVRIVFEYRHDNVLLVRGAYGDGFDFFFRIRGIGSLIGRDQRWDKKPLFYVSHNEELEPQPEANPRSKEQKGHESREIHIHFHTHIHLDSVPPPQPYTTTPLQRT